MPNIKNLNIEEIIKSFNGYCFFKIHIHKKDIKLIKPFFDKLNRKITFMKKDNDYIRLLIDHRNIRNLYKDNLININEIELIKKEMMKIGKIYFDNYCTFNEENTYNEIINYINFTKEILR